MRLTQDAPHRFFRFRNPFKILFSKNNADLSPKLFSKLNSFETNLTVSIRELIPKDENDIISVSWMIQAMESLCETHKSIKKLVTDLELPISEDLEENLIYNYSDVSLKLLELCNAFTSELDRLNHGNLLLKFAFGKLETTNNCAEEFQLSFLDSWNQHIVSKNPRIENCGVVLSKLVESMDHFSKKVRKKNSAKGKVLLRALYGVKVKTLYIFGVLAAAFSGSSKSLFYITVTKEMEELPWGQAFMELQNMINPVIKNTFLSERFTVIKDLEVVESGVKKLYTAIQEGSVVPIMLVEALKKLVIELSERFDLVSKETRCLSKLVISARDVLFESLWTKYAEEFRVTKPMIIIKCVKTCL